MSEDMKGKRYIGFFITAMVPVLLLLGGCTIDQTATDLVNYANQGLLNIAELERKALEHYASAVGENYTTEQRVYEELRDHVVPLYGRFLKGLREVNPNAEEIRRVHGIYLAGAEMLYEGFRTKMMGIEMKNEGVVLQGNEKIIKGREEVNRWRIELVELYKKYGVAEMGSEK
ncbi:MAG: hypothetical protein JW882_11600 [Deltaproteobacteria bacterium]|nr:hypothetical protein [Deltaproteobacteria bacterium]